MGILETMEQELTREFRRSRDKHEAHRRSRPLLEQFSRDPRLLSAILQKYVQTPGVFDRRNYPVVALEIGTTPEFGLVANCWIPLPGGETNITTKAIHHHGVMLLSTATLFGPGYEHWTFSPPKRVAPDSELFRMDLIEAAPHPLHHVAFVDAGVAHVPMYPESLTITLALWSSSHQTSWRDRVKRLPAFAGREAALRRLALRVGLRRALDLKVVEYFDFFPTRQGFKGMRERIEFERGPKDDHIHSCFHVIQQTGNESLAPLIRSHLAQTAGPETHQTVERLLEELTRGTPIAGRLSEGHYDIPHANFTKSEIQSSLSACQARSQEYGSKLTAS